MNKFNYTICYCNVGETGLCFGGGADCEPNDDEAATAKSWFGVEWFETDAVPAFDNGEDSGDPDGVVPVCSGDKVRGIFSKEPWWLGELWTLEAIRAWIAAAEGGPGG